MTLKKEDHTMRVVVITGSTRGIGYGLADSFLGSGCSVVISGRSPEAVVKAVSTLTMKHEAERVFGYPCDVTDFVQVQALWQAARAQFGRVDIWINNAGIAHPQIKFWELPPERFGAVISTNILGTMYGSKVALQGMLAQGFGALYNMEGFGADGKRTMDGLALYGSTKAGLHFFNRSLVKETRGTPLIVGAVQPGMVITDMITAQFEGRPEAWARFQPVLHMIGSPVEAVAPWIVHNIRENQRTGVWITYSTPWRMLGRMLRMLFQHRRNRK
jgi:NAD(P)-dependent dehydrogenase (short-subunit alcohol dehydrogenase family)